MQKSLISVIIPTYNRAAYISLALNSVLEQKVPKGWGIEVIVIDDGSTDNTQEILKPYIDKKQIHYYLTKHCGQPASPRNFGISKSSGEIIAFHDSDDLWTPNKIADQIKLFDDNTTMLTYGQAEIIDKNGKLIKDHLIPANKLSYGEKFELLLLENAISTLTVMVKREALDKVGLFNETDEALGVEDYELWLRISATFPDGIKHTNKSLALYRRHDDNISGTLPLTSSKRIWNALNLLLLYPVLSNKQKDVVENAAEVAYLNYSRQYNQIYGTPVVSVIMGAYNAELFIRPAVDSILSQTFANFEFIIINDGSKDDTLDILRSYNDPRIRIINQQNHGLVFTLNKAIRLSTAEFIARMDADDISLPSRFEKEVEWLCGNPKRGLVSTYFSLIDFETGIPNGTTLAFPIRHTDLRRALYVTNPFPHGACMYRSQAVKSCGLYDKSYISTEDYELWTRVVKTWEVGIIPESLYWYRINNPNSISQLTTETQESFVKKIRSELWEGPFIGKKVRDIRNDLLEIRHEVPIGHRQVAESVYISQQLSITKELFMRNRLKNGLRQLAGTFLISPKAITSLLLHSPKKIIRHIKRAS